MIIGTLPGTCYLKGAYPLKPFGRGGEDLSVYNYPDYNEKVRKFAGVLLGEMLPKPEVWTDNAIVEANLLKDKKTGSYYVSLVNYNGKPVKNLKVMIDAGQIDVREVTSVFQKSKTEKNRDIVTVTLDINDFDFLILK